MNFREGSFVTKGSLLYVIDRQPLQASLSAARAEQATAEARLEKTNNDVARYRPLAAKQSNTRGALRTWFSYVLLVKSCVTDTKWAESSQRKLSVPTFGPSRSSSASGTNAGASSWS